jgi:cytosine/adenosine deaminase-related metal-dependent hydrolase
MLTWARPVSLVNARVLAGDAIRSSVRFGANVLSLDTPPEPGDEVIDLAGAFVLPGLVNAHDHLELNHYGPLKVKALYENASEWIDDLRPLLRTEPSIRSNSAHPLRDRLFLGGLKNLLAGVTTVAHHNPPYGEIGRRFPVRVVSRYGWAHSLALEHQPVGAKGEPGGEVRGRCLATPPHAPFMVHACEGTDRAAAAELGRLDALGCLRANTVLVHGVAIDAAGCRRMLDAGASLVWCPASNLFLFQQTAPVRTLLDTARPSSPVVCLGSDSRLTGARDLLDELQAARLAAPVTPLELLRMVTTAPASILRLDDAGRVAVGVPADLIVVPAWGATPADALLAARRRDLMLVTVGGRPVVADPKLRAVFRARRVAARRVAVDEAERLAAAPLARRMASCPIPEPGVECLE